MSSTQQNQAKFVVVVFFGCWFFFVGFFFHKAVLEFFEIFTFQ